MNAQEYIPADAIAMADKLQSVNILTDTGHRILLQKVNAQELSRRVSNDGLSAVSFYETATPATLLSFLFEAWRDDRMYRLRVLEAIDLEEMLAASSDPEGLRKEFEAWEYGLNGSPIEVAIPAEENLRPDRRGFNIYGHMNLPRGPFNLIHPTRSVLGKTVTRTLDDLLAIGLIDPIVYSEANIGINTEGIYTEDLLLDYLAARTAHYEDGPSNAPIPADITDYETIITDFTDLGLFAHLTPEEIETGRACAATSGYRGYERILLCFPRSVVHFDWEGAEGDAPYTNLTEAFAAASRNKFTPTEIIDEFSSGRCKETTTYGFNFGGRQYRVQLHINNDWLDADFLKMIKHALEDNGAEGSFHYCLDDMQVGGYIYLTPKQANHLKRQHPGLFPEWASEN